MEVVRELRKNVELINGMWVVAVLFGRHVTWSGIIV
jgi:hypothetical protein